MSVVKHTGEVASKSNLSATPQPVKHQIMERDKKGRFIKGNTEGRKYREGDGRLSERIEGGKNSGKQTTMASVLRAELEKSAGKGTGMTKWEYVVAKCLENLAKGKCTPQDLKNIAEVLGELKTNIDLNAAISGKPQLAFADMTKDGDSAE